MLDRITSMLPPAPKVKRSLSQPQGLGLTPEEEAEADRIAGVGKEER